MKTLRNIIKVLGQETGTKEVLLECPKCGTIESFDPTEGFPVCPMCGTQLDIMVDEVPRSRKTSQKDGSIEDKIAAFPTLSKLVAEGVVSYDEDDQEFIGVSADGTTVGLGSIYDLDATEAFLRDNPNPEDW